MVGLHLRHLRPEVAVEGPGVLGKRSSRSGRSGTVGPWRNSGNCDWLAGEEQTARAKVYQMNFNKRLRRPIPGVQRAGLELSFDPRPTEHHPPPTAKADPSRSL